MSDAEGTVELANGHRRAKRALLAACGLFAISVPAWDLSPAFAEFTVASIFFGVIVTGAFSVGAVFLAGAILGDSTRLTAGAGGIVLKRANCFRSQTLRLKREDIATVAVRAIDWDSRADTYSVLVTTRGGETAQSRDFADRSEAEALKARFEAAAGLA